MQLFVGTSGYSYKEWKGSFYPADLPAKRMLEYYAERFSSVEINNTFYRMPRPEVVAGWAATVPADFRFVLKASMRITHRRRLREADEDLRFMLKLFAETGERLGAVLFQLPPNFKQDLERLESFVELLPADCRAAFEFRHPSWFAEDTYACLKRHACALVASDADDEEQAPLVPTCDWGYLRLRRPGYTPEDLQAWCERIRAQDWRHVFCFFKHEDEGTGPELARAFRERFERA